MKNILIIEHGGYLKEFTFQKMKQMECEIFVVTSKFEKWLLKYTDKENILVADTFDLHNIITCVLQWIIEKKIKVDAVGTFKESSVIPTADIAQSLGCIGVSGASARRSSQNKLAMRYFLKKNGYKNQPHFSIIDSNNIEEHYVLNFDAVIKPLFGSSSHGVIKIKNGENVKAKIDDALLTVSASEREVFKNFKGHFILEQYVSGGVFSVDGIVQNEEVMFAGITEFIMGEEPFFTQIGSIIPAKINSDLQAQLYSNTSEVIKILEFDNCGFHAEFRANNDSVFLLEIASRLPGGGIQMGYEKSLGVELTKAMIDVWLGNKVSFSPIHSKYVLHKSVLPTIETDSTLTALTGINGLKQRKEIWDFYQFASVGDILHSYPKTPSQLYYYAIQADTRESLMSLSFEIESEVKYELDNVN